jgi:hypothetical protein
VRLSARKIAGSDRNKMTTDYKNLNLFEIAAVSMIAVGIALVGFQVFMSLPQTAQTKVASALQVFEMSGAAQEVWSIESAANNIVLNRMEDFYDGLFVAIGEVAMPVADDVSEIAGNVSRIAHAFSGISDNIALNYQNNYATPGVEAGMGGKVMGAYVEELLD